MRRPASLTSRLVLTTVGLVVVVAVLLATLSTLALRAYLNDQLDVDVRATLARAERVPAGFQQLPAGPLDDPDDDGDDDGDGPPDVRGQAVGTLTVIYYDDYVDLGDVITDGDDGRTERQPLTDEVLALIDDLPADGDVHEIDLPGLGSYRVAIGETRGGNKVAAGLPSKDVEGAVSRLVGSAALLIAIGGVLAAGGGLLLVRRQLRPLTEVAATAHEVAALPLSEGDIDLTQRVPAHLTDERTEVGQVGAALNALLAHVETSLEARHRSEQQVRQFVADASHELRTPLATIAGYTELARKRPDADTTATALTKVEEESGRMTTLVEDLLLLARLDAGRPMSRETVDLTRLLVEAVSDARVLSPDHHWRIDVPEEPIEVVGDEQGLHQVATNLLANARKHTPAGTTVTVTGRPDGFDVHDDGPGFPEAFVDHAFERFARGDTSRNRAGGAGLGLSLVEAIVRSHLGTVGLRSEPGDTTVEVRLGPNEIV